MTIHDLASEPDIILFLLSGMLVANSAAVAILWRIGKALIPVFLTWEKEFATHKAESDGKFQIVNLRIDENGEQICHLGKRMNSVEIRLLEDKYNAKERPEENGN